MEGLSHKRRSAGLSKFQDGEWQAGDEGMSSFGIIFYGI